MLKKVQGYITKYDLIRPGETVVVGVSGGPDSVVLLHILNQLKERSDLKIHAAHINHGLRPEADSEEQFVKELCADWDVPLAAVKLDIGSLAKTYRKSVEEVGREERYLFMEELRQSIGADKIATAHHRRDQAETVLMHLIQGAGALGLQGMLPRRDRIIRPLLGISREEIIKYIEDKNLPYRIDSSNFDKNYLRNRIRLELLPMLEQSFNPRIEDSLCRLAEVIGEENRYWEDLIATAWDNTVGTDMDGNLKADVNKLRQMPYALRSRFIHKMLGEAGGERVSGADVERVSDLVERRGPGKKVRVSGGLWVSRTHDAIKLGWEKPGTNAEGFCYEIDIPGKLSIPELGIDVITHLLPGIPDPDNKKVCFDWDALDKPLFIRSRRPGDRFRLDGPGGVRKLKDYLIDAKIPVEERDQLGILASAGRVYWIIGDRKSVEGKITSETSNIVAIDVQKSR